MFEITELAKKFLDDRDIQNIFNDFVSNTSEVTGLDRETIEKVGKIIGDKSCSKGFYYIFGTAYNLDSVSDFLNLRECYYINDIYTEELCVHLKYDYEEGGEWIPIIFIKEFWDFYSVYNAGNKKEIKKVKEETNNRQNTSTKIYNILDNATELQHIRSSLENLNLNYNEICEILEAIVKKL